MQRIDEILVLLERISRVLQNEGHADDLKPTQWEALRYFQRANRFSRSPSALTAYLGMTKGTVSQTVNALERKQLIKKHNVENDRRLVRIELTEKAISLLNEDPLTHFRNTLDSLKAPHQKTLRDSLAELLRGALRDRQRRQFGACRTCRYFQKNHTEGAPFKCGLLDEPLTLDDSSKICFEHEETA